MTELPRSVLCVRLGAIGDVANALVVATAIKDAAPATEVGWAVHPLSAPLLEGHPCVDRVHVVPRSKRPGVLRSVVRDLRAPRYDAALDLQRLQKSSLLARLSGARRVVGFDRARCKEASWLWTNERIAAGPRDEHMVRQYMRFPARLGFTEPERAAPRHALPTPAESVAFAEDLVAREGTPVLLNLGASKPEKLWPRVSFREVAAALIERGLGPVALTGGPGDRDAAAEVGDGLDVVDLTGRTSLPDVWELCRRSRAMLTADTGPMHLCAAVGTPVVALFGPGDPARTGPFGAAHVVFRGGARVAVLAGESPARGSARAPMSDTSPAQALGALEELLAHV